MELISRTAPQEPTYDVRLTEGEMLALRYVLGGFDLREDETQVKHTRLPNAARDVCEVRKGLDRALNANDVPVVGCNLSWVNRR